MSFQSELLDCYDLLKKRAASTTEAEHALGSFLKNFVYGLNSSHLIATSRSTLHKDWLSKFTDFINKSKKEYSSKMDGTVSSAFSTILDEMLLAYQTQMSFTEEVLKVLLLLVALLFLLVYFIFVL